MAARPSGLGTLVALTFLALVFGAGVFLGSLVTWRTLAARCGL